VIQLTIYQHVEILEWNKSWTNTPSLNTAMNSGASYQGTSGTQTSALSFGGFTPSLPLGSAVVQSYNGSSWTTVNSLNTARRRLGGAGDSNSSAVAFGGDTGPAASALTATELWNGTSWTTSPVGLSSAQFGGGSAGNKDLALFFGGQNSADTTVATTQEWTGPSYDFKL
jgi:hypothetical protein